MRIRRIIASCLLACGSVCLAAEPDARQLRGIVETHAGQRHEGWITGSGDELTVHSLSAGEPVKVPAADLKMASMHLAGRTPHMAAGLQANYVRGLDPNGPAERRIDPQIDFDWNDQGPLPGFPNDRFSVRWQGHIKTEAAGDYQFHTLSDDGVRLWVNEVPVIDRWVGQAAAERSGRIHLDGKRSYPFRMEYFEDTGLAEVHLRWTTPEKPKHRIPSEAFSHATWSSPEKPSERPANGLIGSYFEGQSFAVSAIDRIDPVIDFDWQSTKPAGSLGPHDFCVRWRGGIESPVSGKIRFHIRSNDGVRLWVDERPVIDRWKTGTATEYWGEIALESGRRYPIQIEYFQAQGESVIELSWSGSGLEKQVVPSERLFASTSKGIVLRRDIGVILTGGSFIAGAVTGFDEKFLTIDPTEGASLRIPMRNIGGLQFRRLDPSAMREAIGRTPGCTTMNGDHFESKLQALNEGQLSMHSSLFGQRTFASTNVRFVKIGEFSQRPAKFQIRTRSGSVIRSDWIQLSGQQVLVKDNSICWLKLDPAEISTISGVIKE